MRLAAIIALAVAASLTTPALAHPIGEEEAAKLPIFDAHIHYKEPAWEAFPPDTVLKLMDRNGVAMALVSSTPDEGTIMLWEHAPGRIVPELRPYLGDWGSSNWTEYDGMADYIENRLAKYPHRGIGEFHVRAMETTNKGLLRLIAGMAKERDIPIHIHSDAAPVEFFYKIDPDLTIIWAHAGMSEPPEIIGPMMDRYPTLYADTSFREYDILDRTGGMDKAWEALLLKHSDRFMVGSDTWVNSQWADYDRLIQSNREWLAMLPREAAEAIAYRNAERLFGITVSRDQLGTR